MRTVRVEKVAKAASTHCILVSWLILSLLNVVLSRTHSRVKGISPTAPLKRRAIGLSWTVMSTSRIRCLLCPHLLHFQRIVRAGIVSTTSYVASNNSSYTPANSLASPYASINQPTGSTLGYSQGLGDALVTIDQHRQSPYMQEYSFDVQAELPTTSHFKPVTSALKVTIFRPVMAPLTTSTRSTWRRFPTE